MDLAAALPAISKTNPFVADIGENAPTITPIPAVGGINPTSVAAEPPSFKDTVVGILSDTNSKLNTSDANQRDLASGKTNDLQKVVTSVEEANLAMEFTMAMRSKLLEAYQEVARMQI